MAHADNVPLTSPSMDYAEHERTYRMFTGMAKWGTIGVVILVVLMAIFLV